MKWSMYPNIPDQFYAIDGDLVLIASEQGAWAVYSKTSRVSPRNSELSTVVGPFNLSDAMECAQNAAKAMNSNE